MGDDRLTRLAHLEAAAEHVGRRRSNDAKPAQVERVERWMIEAETALSPRYRAIVAGWYADAAEAMKGDRGLDLLAGVEALWTRIRHGAPATDDTVDEVLAEVNAHTGTPPLRIVPDDR